MIIKNAKIEDAKAIKIIMFNHNISRNSKKQTGLIEYHLPSQNELKNKLKNNPFFYVIESEGKIVGFLSAYKDDLLKNLNFSDDEIVRHILKKQQPFIYVDLIVIEKEYQNKGIGKLLLERLIKGSENYTIYGPISHHPHRNDISIKLLTSFGFKLIEEINVYNGLIFGIYKKGGART